MATADPAPNDERPEVAAWRALVDALGDAGQKLAEDTAHLDDAERADGFRALVRALGNQLARFEVDQDRPELVAFNGWRQKFLMDNPDFRYWVADVRGGGPYRITGNRGDAAYLSITAYAPAGATGTHAVARIDSDAMAFDADGGFEVRLGGPEPSDGGWVDLPEDANAVWVRHFHDDVRHDRLGWCAIEPLDDPPAPEPIDPDRFTHHLRRLASTTAMLPAIFSHAAAADLATPNELRHWSEMSGGAAYTEPGIHYLRGGWQLDDGEALVLEGDVVACRYWNVLLYSRFLNSLDHRHRTVSHTGATATVTDGCYRFVVSAAEPPPGTGDWLDSEGRREGIVVMRFLQPASEPALPSVRLVRLDELSAR